MKKYIIPVIFCSLVSSIFLSSCESFRVPGESKLILKNISNEYYNIAEGYFGIKNYSKAAEYYKLAMRNKDYYLTSYYKLARAYAMAQDWDSAQSCYEELLKRDSDNTTLKVSIAYVTAMRGETDKAIEQFKSLNETNPYDEQILSNYIALLLFVERAEDAEIQYRALKEKFPDNAKIKDYAKRLSELTDNFSDDEEIPSKK